ncbi:MAG: hypothetical protein A2X23_08385 [Chloroflexi bacterium GWC2_73_18]|nr:MAG: hypothetical protein A2X23_08385 [Chloroflexi bacterium GWC2_73_18]
MILLYFLLGGLALGLLGGGHPARLGRVELRWAPLALGGLAAQVVLFSPQVAAGVGAAGPPLYLGSTVVVLAVLLRNVRQPWFALVALGAALNLAAIAANGGVMPADPGALAVLRGDTSPSGAFTNSAPMAGAALAFLGDVFAAPRWLPFANVFSVGDVLIGLGGAAWLVATLRRRSDEAPAVAAERPDGPVAAGARAARR